MKIEVADVNNEHGGRAFGIRIYLKSFAMNFGWVVNWRGPIKMFNHSNPSSLWGGNWVVHQFSAWRLRFAFAWRASK